MERTFPPLNPEQSDFARQHYALQKILHSASVNLECPVETLRKSREEGYAQIKLLQGAGGVGKSVLLKNIQRVITEEGLGSMIITA